MYLNLKTKTYYQEDFRKLLDEKDSFWKIDSAFLKSILISINRNQKLQTLYSKHDPKEESYLFIAYSKDIELDLFRYRIPQILACNKFIDYEYVAPRINLNREINNGISIGCVRDEDYFNIHHIRLGLTSSNPEEHAVFWSLLERQLDFK